MVSAPPVTEEVGRDEPPAVTRLAHRKEAQTEVADHQESWENKQLGRMGTGVGEDGTHCPR